MGDYFIGVDCGTQSTKAILVNCENGKVLAQASVKYGLLPNLPEDAKEQNPHTWVQAMEKTIKTVVAESKVKSDEVKGIGISGQQHGFVPLDGKDKVIRPAKLWCDTSTAMQAEAIIRKFGGIEQVINTTGNSIPTGFTASKVLWLKQKEPKNFSQLETILLPHDYLNFHLTGEKSMEAGDASGTGFLNVRTRLWETRVLDAIDSDLLRKLPAIRSSEQPAGELLPEVARRLGLQPGILVSSGGGDNMMGAIGTGNTRIGVVTASLGTSGTLYAYSPRPIIDPQGEIAAFCDSTGAWLPLICTMNVTVATELVKGAFKWDNEKLSHEVAAVPTGCEGLFLLPYFNGERVPNLPQGRGVYFGLNSKNFSQAHMARAAMEGATFGLNYGLNRMRDLGIRPKQIRVTGGGSQDPAWRQILADIFDAEVVGLQTSEGAAFGAALQARWAYGISRGERIRISQLTDKLVKIDKSKSATPKKENVKRYRELQQFYNELSRQTTPLFARHATLR